MSTASSLSLKPSYVSDASLQSLLANGPYNFITFITIIQKLKIEILDFTWQAVRQPIAVGATDQINEVLINLHTSTVFKRVSYEQKERESEETIFQMLINEVVVLGHESIRNHPNIVELQGICWDISSDDKGDEKTWPILVFKKAEHKDLYNFAMLPVGRELCFAERLKLCMEVGTAIRDMHSNNIVHGNINPKNVLIFNEDGEFVAKVAGFRCAARIANEDDLIHVPKTDSLYAPEHSYESVTPAQARKMDVFSVGMLCMWVMFEKYLSGITPLPKEAYWAKQYFQCGEGEHLNQKILRDLKQDGGLVMLAQQLMTAEKDLDDERKKALCEFVSVSLAYSPDERVSSEPAFDLLVPN